MFTARNGTAISLIVVVSAFVKIMYRKKEIRNAVSSQKGDSLFKSERVFIFIGLPFILKPVNPLVFFIVVGGISIKYMHENFQTLLCTNKLFWLIHY